MRSLQLNSVAGCAPLSAVPAECDQAAVCGTDRTFECV
jgi:hypothetical protein